MLRCFAVTVAVGGVGVVVVAAFDFVDGRHPGSSEVGCGIFFPARLAGEFYTERRSGQACHHGQVSTLLPPCLWYAFVDGV